MAKKNIFWIAMTDLMTSMFFIMLVILCGYLVSYDDNDSLIYKLDEANEKNEKLKEEVNTLGNKVSLLKSEKVVLIEEKEVIETVKKMVSSLDNNLFEYDNKYKRYTLISDVQFKKSRYNINSYDVYNYGKTKSNLLDVGRELKRILDKIKLKKREDKNYKDVNFIVVIAGSASKLGDEEYNFILSYKRALGLYKFWKEYVVDFDSEKYHDIAEFQIAGTGEGGVGRYPDSQDNKNQRFIINIVPKVSDLNIVKYGTK